MQPALRPIFLLLTQEAERRGRPRRLNPSVPALGVTRSGPGVRSSWEPLTTTSRAGAVATVRDPVRASLARRSPRWGGELRPGERPQTWMLSPG